MTIFKKNLPVTDIEYTFPETQKLISSTDLKGKIRHCNQAFADVIGFTQEELFGKPHNIVSHPDGCSRRRTNTGI